MAPRFPTCLESSQRAPLSKEATANAEAVPRDYGVEAKRDGSVPEPSTSIDNARVSFGRTVVSIPVIQRAGRSVRLNLSLDEGFADFIDQETRRRGMTDPVRGSDGPPGCSAVGMSLASAVASLPRNTTR